MLHSSLMATRRWFAEHRLVWFASSNPNKHQADIENSLDAFKQPSPPSSAADLQKRMELMSRQATLDVQGAAPTWARRIRRFVGGGLAGAVGVSVNNAEKAEVSDAIDRATLQRTATAQKELDLAGDAALQKINSRARKTTNSFAFLKEKAAVCNEVVTSLQQELDAAKQRLDAAKAIKSMDKSLLQRSVEQLSKRKRVVEEIRGDVQRKVDGSVEGMILHQTQEADKYLREVITLYKPDLANEVNEILVEWVNENAGLKPRLGTSRLETSLKEVAAEMFPDDPALQKKQYDSMYRIAQKLTGSQGFWRTIGGMTAGVLTLGGKQLIYNKIRYGTKTRKGWQDSQIANYYQELPLQGLRLVGEIQAIPTLLERLKKMKDLKPGTAFTVTLNGANQDLKMLNSRGDLVFAVDATGKRYALDLKGDGGKNYFTYEKTGGGFEHKEIKLGTNVLFEIS